MSSDHPRISDADSPTEIPSAAKRATVLLVEDDGLIRMNTAELLEDEGFVAVEAASGEEALTALQTMSVDALVTDVNLPGLSGTDLATRAEELHDALLIIFATGDPSAVRGRTHAVVVSKPYDPADLARAIRAHEDKRSREDLSG